MGCVVPERCEFHPGDLLDEYRIERLLGEGTFGFVYKATDPVGHTVAIKLLKLWTVPTEVYKNMRDRFTMEFETGRIESSYLARSISYGEVKGNPYIVMEFCSRGDLRGFLASNQANLIPFARHILCGLRDLHIHGKVHRDLKPENVLIKEDFTAVLTDFGISGDRNKRMTERGWIGKPTQIFGTYPYMPPEQVNPPRGGQATVLPTTDIFSFGVMMYELLVGDLPFGELSEATLHTYLENGRTGRWNRDALRYKDPTGVWLPVIEACLVPDFKERAQSADEVLKLLPEVNGFCEEKLRHSFMEVISGVLLRVMQGEEYGKVYHLNEMLKGERRLLTVGRMNLEAVNDIPIVETLSTYISRRHCTLEYDNVRRVWYLRDGQWANKTGGYGWFPSLNGTYVNSTEVDPNGMEIHPGDIISMGDVKLRVEGY